MSERKPHGHDHHSLEERVEEKIDEDREAVIAADDTGLVRQEVQIVEVDTERGIAGT